MTEDRGQIVEIARSGCTSYTAFVALTRERAPAHGLLGVVDSSVDEMVENKPCPIEGAH